jgi:cadmium resistance protein CadD (predicted permease)
MSPILTVVAASVTMFAATNVDDIFLLTLFFARCVPTRRIVAGQYLGFAAIVAVTLAAVWTVGLAVPRAWVRPLGILPIAIGMKELLQTRKGRRVPKADGSLSMLRIAAITLANRADNIGVYVPFFMISQSYLWLVLAVYGSLILIWCAVPNRLEGTRPLGPLDWAVCTDRVGKLPFAVHVTLTLRWIKANATTTACATLSLLPAVVLAARCRALASVLSSTRRRPAQESARESLR